MGSRIIAVRSHTVQRSVVQIAFRCFSTQGCELLDVFDMLKRVAAGLVLVCLLLNSPCALAEPTAAAKSASGEEVLSKLLEHADANRDGYVGVIELQRFVTQHVLLQVEERVRRLDRNSDGRVTAVEVPHMPAERFTRF